MSMHGKGDYEETRDVGTKRRKQDRKKHTLSCYPTRDSSESGQWREQCMSLSCTFVQSLPSSPDTPLFLTKSYPCEVDALPRNSAVYILPFIAPQRHAYNIGTQGRWQDCSHHCSGWCLFSHGLARCCMSTTQYETILTCTLSIWSALSTTHFLPYKHAKDCCHECKWCSLLWEGHISWTEVSVM